MVTNDDDCDVINDDGQAKKPGPVLLLKVQRGWRTIFQASTALKTIVIYLAQNYCEPFYIWRKTIVNHYIFGTQLLWTILYCVSCEKTIVHHDIFGTKLLGTMIYLVPLIYLSRINAFKFWSCNILLCTKLLYTISYLAPNFIAPNYLYHTIFDIKLFCMMLYYICHQTLLHQTIVHHTLVQ